MRGSWIPAIFNTDCGFQLRARVLFPCCRVYGIQINIDNVIVEQIRKIYVWVFLHDYETMAGLSNGGWAFVEPFKPGEVFSRTWTTKHQIMYMDWK